MGAILTVNGAYFSGYGSFQDYQLVLGFADMRAHVAALHQDEHLDLKQGVLVVDILGWSVLRVRHFPAPLRRLTSPSNLKAEIPTRALTRPWLHPLS